jgi:hypothetical protein
VRTIHWIDVAGTPKAAEIRGQRDVDRGVETDGQGAQDGDEDRPGRRRAPAVRLERAREAQSGLTAALRRRAAGGGSDVRGRARPPRQRLGERRMRVNRAREIARDRAHLDGERPLGQQFAGVRSDDAHAQEPPGRGLEHELREPVGPSHGDGAPGRAPRHLRRPHFDAAGPRVGLHQAAQATSGSVNTPRGSRGARRPQGAQRPPRPPPAPRRSPCAPASAHPPRPRSRTRAGPRCDAGRRPR